MDSGLQPILTINETYQVDLLFRDLLIFRKNICLMQYLFEPFEEADMKIYVGNMNFDTTESDLRTAFEAHGTVDTVNIITDRDTGRAKGFGFVEMSNDTEGQAAIDALNDKELQDRTLKVNVAKPRADNRGGGGGGRY